MTDQWPAIAQRAYITATAFARVAFAEILASYANGQLAAQHAAAIAQLATLEAELRLVRSRLARVEARRRPHYRPIERMEILTLRAAHGWNVAETVSRFLVSELTLATWMAALDAGGERALVRTRVPINKLPAFVGELARELGARYVVLGARRIAQLFARGGVPICATTVRRMLAATPAPTPAPERERAAPPPAPSGRRVVAKASHDVWNIDLTLLPTVGLWVPWYPFALVQRWPWCFWLAVVLDHHSRNVVSWKLYQKQPCGRDIVELLEQAKLRAGRAPRHIVTDSGSQFSGDYETWCADNGVRPRWGAVGEHGSIAVLERFWRSLKHEMFRTWHFSAEMPQMEADIAAYMEWYHEHRPHQGLGGMTPAEKLAGAPPIAERELMEPRARYPIRDGTKRRRVGRLVLVVDHVDGRRNLPIVSLREAA